jgi:hypothetical protein
MYVKDKIDGNGTFILANTTFQYRCLLVQVKLAKKLFCFFKNRPIYNSFSIRWIISYTCLIEPNLFCAGIFSLRISGKRNGKPETRFCYTNLAGMYLCWLNNTFGHIGVLTFSSSTGPPAMLSMTPVALPLCNVVPVQSSTNGYNHSRLLMTYWLHRSSL